MNDRSRDELLAAIRREFDVVFETVRLDNLTLQMVRVSDPDSILDEQTLASGHTELEWHPYWAEAWAASYGVAEELTHHDLNGQLVLDLGCGLGMTGAVAAARGASVVMADYAPPALQFARWNTWPWRDQVRIVRLDWRKDALPERFDWIVGSEILYDRDELLYLDAFWKQHLNDTGVILLGDAQRGVSAEMLEQLQSRGWSVTVCPGNWSHDGRQLRLVKLRRSAG